MVHFFCKFYTIFNCWLKACGCWLNECWLHACGWWLDADFWCLKHKKRVFVPCRLMRIFPLYVVGCCCRWLLLPLSQVIQYAKVIYENSCWLFLVVPLSSPSRAPKLFTLADFWWIAKWPTALARPDRVDSTHQFNSRFYFNVLGWLRSIPREPNHQHSLFYSRELANENRYMQIVTWQRLPIYISESEIFTW